MNTLDETVQKCLVCSSPQPKNIAAKTGKLNPAYIFKYFRCSVCGFCFIANPNLDFERIYNKDYYEGNGLDKLVNYDHEIKYPDKTVRLYEWEGVLRNIQELFANSSIINTHTPELEGVRWLDFGCGNGSLVRYINENTKADCYGFDLGYGAEVGKSTFGISILSEKELESQSSSFDVITAIEVFEHLADPMETFLKIKHLLKPGGFLFYTTGNSYPFKDDLLKWSYSNVPEVHICFFEPKTIEIAAKTLKLEILKCGFQSGSTSIYKFKILKSLGFRNRHFILDMLPWKLIAKIADKKFQLTQFPILIKEKNEE